jgi:hypothetical protein
MADTSVEVVGFFQPEFGQGEAAQRAEPGADAVAAPLPVPPAEDRPPAEPVG